MPEQVEPELLQSLETVLEESRRLRKESTLLLDQAQWPEVAPIQKEENSPPIPDLLSIPVPPLLGFQREKGNLPLGLLTPTVQPGPGNAPPEPETPAGGQSPSPTEAVSELAASEILAPAVSV